MDPRALAAEVEASLTGAADPARAAWMARMAPTAERMLGVGVPILRAVVRDLEGRLRFEPADRVVEVAAHLAGGGLFEGRQAACELVWLHRATRAAVPVEDVVRLGRGLDNWASVDAFSVCVAGPSWRTGHVTDARVLTWTASPDRWWRRVALVCTVALNQRSRGGRGDVPRTLAVCGRLVQDPDEVVRKALSWALREALGRDRDAVLSFLARHGEALPARVRREVGHKARTGLKAPRRGPADRPSDGS